MAPRKKKQVNLVAPKPTAEKYIEIKKVLTKCFRKAGINSPTITKGQSNKVDITQQTIFVTPWKQENSELHGKELFVEYMMGLYNKGGAYQKLIKDIMVNWL